MTRELLQVQEDKENGCIKLILLYGIEFPAPAPFGYRKCGGKMIEKFMAGDVFRSEAHTCGEDCWQSMMRNPQVWSWRTSETSATFEASGTRVNIDSAKKAPPSATP